MTQQHKAVRVTITGRVQGVSFRWWTARQADQLGLSGWVRNQPDGSVSALLAGAEADVAAMLARFREGPPAAVVRNVAVEAADIEDAPSGFRITG